MEQNELEQLKELYARIETLAKPKFGSVKDLEIAIGFTPSIIQKWKNHSPSAPNLYRVAQALGVSMEYLLKGEDNSLQTLPIEQTEKPIAKKKAVKKIPLDNDEIPYSGNPRDKMNKTTVYYEQKYKNGTSHKFPLQVNTQCPICRHDNQPKLINFLPDDFNATDIEFSNRVGIFLCTRCHHTFSVLYKQSNILTNGYINYAIQKELPTVDSVYTPYRSAIPKLPEAFNKPEFAKFRQAYEDLCWAKDYQIDGLVGMAYRRALECLVKDFLISEGYKTEYKTISKESLSNLLQAMSNEIIEDCGRAANHFSNDYVHYEDNHPDITVKEIAEFFDEILEKIKDYLIRGKALCLFDPNHKELSKNKNKTLKNNSTEVLNKIAEENRDLFCDDRFVDSVKLYRNFSDEKRERVFAYILGIATALSLPIEDILGKKVL